MRIDAMHMKNESQLIADYKNGKEIRKFFDYDPFKSFGVRAEELKMRQFKRNELAPILEECNTRWGAGEETLKQIEKLKNPDSVVVVGGQQAGLLTGPLYTINKVISIIQLAREQEEILGTPVLPVFWIAGEDHDYEEINHVFLPEKQRLKKFKFNQSHYKKKPISEIKLDKSLAEKWINELFSTLEETIHTKEIYNMILKAIHDSESFTDFFATLIHRLFEKEGLILLDAADKRVRKIENDYFIRLIENQPKISEGVTQASKELANMDYTTSLEDLDPSDGHLFYHQDEERILLKRTEEGDWIGKQEEINLSTEELLKIANEQPEKLSNNVVTRPIMQELLLPTLAFIGGPGEIGYWSILKPAFHSLDLKMPPVVPRLSFTFIPERTKKALVATGISLETALHHGSADEKEKWLLSKQQPPITQLADDLKKVIEQAHQPIRRVAEDIRDDIGALAEKNLFYLHREIDYLTNRMEQALEEKYEKEISQFDLIQMMLHPEGGLQERTWSVLPFLNEYGTEFISKLARSSCSFKNQHYIVEL